MVGMAVDPVFVRCLSCGQKLRVPAEKVGQAGRCPRCKTPFAAVSTPADAPTTTRKPPERFVRWLTACCWLWVVLVLAVAAVLHLGSETWWGNTLLLYSPRWLVLTGAALLAPFAACWNWRSLAILAGGLVAWLFLISGLILHWPGDAEQTRPGTLRVLTCNMQGQLANPDRFLTVLIKTQPDLVLLQEWNGELNRAAFGDQGWNLVQSGHLWVASRLPIQPVGGLPACAIHLSGDAGAFEVLADSGPIRLVNVHLPTPREGISGVLDSRFRDVAPLRANTLARSQASSAARQFCGDDPSLIVAGDFNLPVESSIYYQHWSDLGNAFSRRGCGLAGRSTRSGTACGSIRFCLAPSGLACTAASAPALAPTTGRCSQCCSERRSIAFQAVRLVL